MVTVSHCCPITNRACCSFALRRLIPLNWKQRQCVRNRQRPTREGYLIGSVVGFVPRGVGHRTLNGLDERCCLLLLWTQIRRRSPHSRLRSPTVLLLSVLSHCVAPPSMAFRDKRTVFKQCFDNCGKPWKLQEGCDSETENQYNSKLSSMGRPFPGILLALCIVIYFLVVISLKMQLLAIRPQK